MEQNEIKCKICGEKIADFDYFKGINYIHHITCHIRVYGLEFDD